MDRYEEALERAKKGLPIDEVFPELKESEDERIRKMLIEQIERWKKAAEDNNIEVKDASAAIAYLEKQKENPKSADSIPSDCTSDAKYEGRWHNVKDSLPDSTREVLCKDAIGNYFIGRYYSKGVWEVSMYDDCDKSNEDNPPVVKWCEIPSEKQKEQKPESCDCSRDEESYFNGIHHVLMNPEAYGLIKLKPAKWSEEDNNALVLFHELISFGYTERFCDAQTAEDMRRWLNERLKSTRPQPHWKPSEEQIEAKKRGLL